MENNHKIILISSLLVLSLLATSIHHINIEEKENCIKNNCIDNQYIDKNPNNHPRGGLVYEIKSEYAALSETS